MSTLDDNHERATILLTELARRYGWRVKVIPEDERIAPDRLYILHYDYGHRDYIPRAMDLEEAHEIFLSLPYPPVYCKDEQAKSHPQASRPTPRPAPRPRATFTPPPPEPPELNPKLFEIAERKGLRIEVSRIGDDPCFRLEPQPQGYKHDRNKQSPAFHGEPTFVVNPYTDTTIFTLEQAIRWLRTLPDLNPEP